MKLKFLNAMLLTVLSLGVTAIVSCTSSNQSSSPTPPTAFNHVEMAAKDLKQSTGCDFVVEKVEQEDEGTAENPPENTEKKLVDIRYLVCESDAEVTKEMLQARKSALERFIVQVKKLERERLSKEESNIVSEMLRDADTVLWSTERDLELYDVVAEEPDTVKSIEAKLNENGCYFNKQNQIECSLVTSGETVMQRLDLLKSFESFKEEEKSEVYSARLRSVMDEARKLRVKKSRLLTHEQEKFSLLEDQFNIDTGKTVSIHDQAEYDFMIKLLTKLENKENLEKLKSKPFDSLLLFSENDLNMNDGKTNLSSPARLHCIVDHRNFDKAWKFLANLPDGKSEAYTLRVAKLQALEAPTKLWMENAGYSVMSSLKLDELLVELTKLNSISSEIRNRNISYISIYPAGWNKGVESRISDDGSIIISIDSGLSAETLKKEIVNRTSPVKAKD